MQFSNKFLTISTVKCDRISAAFSQLKYARSTWQQIGLITSSRGRWVHAMVAFHSLIFFSLWLRKWEFSKLFQSFCIHNSLRFLRQWQRGKLKLTPTESVQSFFVTMHSKLIASSSTESNFERWKMCATFSPGKMFFCVSKRCSKMIEKAFLCKLNCIFSSYSCMASGIRKYYNDIRGVCTVAKSRSIPAKEWFHAFHPTKLFEVLRKAWVT